MITELTTFIAVCRHGTFAAAGERIGLTQSAVSSQIKRLEAALGFALFDRTGRSATLNAAGHATLARAEEICALYARLGELPDDASAAGVLRVGSISSAQPTVLARALEVFRKSFPVVRVHVSPGVSMRLMDDLDAGHIDVALMIRPPFGMPPDMAWQTLVQEPYVLVAPLSAPRTDDWRALLQSEPFLRYDRASFGGRMVEGFLRKQGLAVHDAIEIDEIPGLIHLASRGLGVALLPLVEAHLPLPSGLRVLPLGEDTFYREVGLLQRKSPSVSPLVARFAQHLREAVAPVTSTATASSTAAAGKAAALPRQKRAARR